MARRNDGSSCTSAASRSNPATSGAASGFDATQSAIGRAISPCGTRAREREANRGTGTPTSCDTSQGPAGNSTRPARGGASTRRSPAPAGTLSSKNCPLASVRADAVPMLSCASGRGTPATRSRPRSTRRGTAAKSSFSTSPRYAGPTSRETGPAALHPGGRRTVSVPRPSKARKRKLPSAPVLSSWLRSPWRSVTRAPEAPAPDGSPTLPSMMAGAMASSAHSSTVTASICSSEDHAARIRAAEHPGKPGVLPHHLARVGADRRRDARPLVVAQPARPRVVGHEGLFPAREAALEPGEVPDREPDVDHRILADGRAVADVRLAPRDPGEGGRLQLHEPVGAALAGDVRPESALDRDQPEDEEGVVTAASRLAQHGLRQLRPQLRIERPGNAREKCFQVLLPDGGRWACDFGPGPAKEQERRQGARDCEHDAHRHHGDPGASPAHAPPGRGLPAQSARPRRLTTGRFARQGVVRVNCMQQCDTTVRLPPWRRAGL